MLTETLVVSPFENLFILSLEKFFDVIFLRGLFALIQLHASSSNYNFLFE